MCGICGWSEGSPVAFDRKGLMDGMLDSLQHRGPDDWGIYSNDEVMMGMRRLSIIDVEGGHQPIMDEGEKAAIIYNGELYNAPVLRKELEAKGHSFRTHSDTEVILKAYLEWGTPCLKRLRGMFAIAIWDRDRDELILARDPFGIKPLLYAELPHAVVFASEFKALLQYPNFPRKMDVQALQLYLTLNYVPAPMTIWEAAKKLPPGHFLRVKDGRVVENSRYFYLNPEPWQGDVQDAVDELHSALKASVDCHLLSDVPLGAFLSGGLDSSLIVALAQEAQGDPLHTFTISFPDFPVFDESKYASQVAAHLGTMHQEIPVTLTEAHQVLPEVLDYLDEPFADPSLIPSAILSRMTSAHVKVALSGDGGDELFAGYNKYVGLNMAPRIAVARPVLRLLSRLPLSESRSTAFGNRWRRFQKLSYIVSSDRMESSARAMEIFHPGEVDRLLKIRHSDANHLLRKRLAPLFLEGSELGLQGLNQTLYVDANIIIPNQMMSKVDTASMRYGLEARVPLIDPEIARLAFSFPMGWKMHKSRRKWILFQVASRYLPASVLNRPKGGFDIPLGEWLKDELQPMFREILATNKSEGEGYFDGKFLTRLFEEHIQGRKDHFLPLWNILVFEWWRKRWNPSL